MRLFIAVRLSDETVLALTDLQKELRRLGYTGNYTKRENLHLTLAFIGEVRDPEPVKKIMDGMRFEPFLLTLQKTGTFPGIVWAGMEVGALSSFAAKLRRALNDAGIPCDNKRFTPHVTLLRRPQGEALPLPDPRPVAMTAKKISLMLSERTVNGMRYTEIHSVDGIDTP